MSAFLKWLDHGNKCGTPEEAAVFAHTHGADLYQSLQHHRGNVTGQVFEYVSGPVCGRLLLDGLTEHYGGLPLFNRQEIIDDPKTAVVAVLGEGQSATVREARRALADWEAALLRDPALSIIFRPQATNPFRGKAIYDAFTELVAEFFSAPRGFNLALWCLYESIARRCSLVPELNDPTTVFEETMKPNCEAYVRLVAIRSVVCYYEHTS